MSISASRPRGCSGRRRAARGRSGRRTTQNPLRPRAVPHAGSRSRRLTMRRRQTRMRRAAVADRPPPAPAHRGRRVSQPMRRNRGSRRPDALPQRRFRRNCVRSSSGTSANAPSQSASMCRRRSTAERRIARSYPRRSHGERHRWLRPAGPAARGPARRGSAARRSSDRRPASHAERPEHSGAGPESAGGAGDRLVDGGLDDRAVRRAINSAAPLRFNGSASTSAAAHDSVASAAASAASTAPRCASVCASARVLGGALIQRRGDGPRSAQPARRDSDRAVPEPGRDRYSPGRPTGRRAHR